MNRGSGGTSLIEFAVSLGVMAFAVMLMATLITWFNREASRALGQVNFNSDISDLRASLSRRYRGERMNVGGANERDLPYDFRESAKKANEICDQVFDGVDTTLDTEVTIKDTLGNPLFRANLPRNGYRVTSAKVVKVSQSATDPKLRLVTFRVTAAFGAGIPSSREVLILARVNPATNEITSCEKYEPFEPGRVYGNCTYQMDAGFTTNRILGEVRPAICPLPGASGPAAWVTCDFPGFRPVVISMVQMNGTPWGQQLDGQYDFYVQSVGCAYEAAP